MRILVEIMLIFPLTNFGLDNLMFWRLEHIIALFGFEPDRKPTYKSYGPIQNYMHENAKKKCPKRPMFKDIDVLFANLDTYMKCK